MSDIQRLIRVAARRNTAEEYTMVRFRALRCLVDRFRRRTMEDGLSGNVVIEAVIEGYLNSHPAVLAMIDQWVRDHEGEQAEAPSVKMSRRDLDEIYAASSRGMTPKEETE